MQQRWAGECTAAQFCGGLRAGPDGQREPRVVKGYFPPAAAADGGICGRGRPSAGAAAGALTPCAADPDSMKRPKIILPAVVCSTLVTTTSIVFPIAFRALSTTTIVPSSR